MAPEIESVYLPHSVNTEIFAPYDDNFINNIISTNFKGEKRFRVFWNNRNARRKMSGSVLWWFNEWAEKVGPENVQLIMHTDPKDPNGQDLEQIIHEIGATDGRILISNNRAVSPTDLAIFYNVCDCTVNIADAEGFGLATLESLACGTPIIVNMTGGLQEQVRDEEGNWFGVGIERAEILASIRGVIKVVTVDDSDGTVCEALRREKPTFFANGGDRKTDNTPEMAEVS